MSSLTDLLFVPGVGIRTSTVLMGVLLVVFGAIRRQPLQGQLAALAWVFGFEIAFEITAYATSGGHLPGAPGWLVFGAVANLMAWEAKVKIEWRWFIVTAVLWVIWLATGFHYNMRGVGTFDWGAELINELTKTAWGLAYLWPFFRMARPASAQVAAAAATPRSETSPGRL
jgi:hypothetical protein